MAVVASEYMAPSPPLTLEIPFRTKPEVADRVRGSPAGTSLRGAGLLLRGLGVGFGCVRRWGGLPFDQDSLTRNQFSFGGVRRRFRIFSPFVEFFSFFLNLLLRGNLSFRTWAGRETAGVTVRTVDPGRFFGALFAS